MNPEKFDPVVKICENLPLDLTIFERKGCCQKPDSTCRYNLSNFSPDIKLCHKKTSTSLPLLRSIT